jgi:hypothetical protein
MFAGQGNLLNALRAHYDPLVVSQIEGMLEQCAAELEHRGPVSIEVHPDHLRNAPCHTISDGAQAAGLTVRTYAGQYTRDPELTGEGVMCGPTAIYTQGPVYARPNEDNFSFIGKCVDWECIYADSLITNNIEVTEEIELIVMRWAVAQSNWDYASAPPSQGGGVAWVMSKFCDDSTGANPTGEAFRVYLPVGAARDPNIEAGQVLSIQQANDESWVCEFAGDDPILTVKYWASNDDPPGGWEFYEDVYGLTNDTFPAAWDDPDAELLNGGVYHDHEDHGGEIDDHVFVGATDAADTGLLVPPVYSETAEARANITVYDPNNQQFHHLHWHDFAYTYTVRSVYLNTLPAGLDQAPNRDFEEEGPFTHNVYDPGHSHFFYNYWTVTDPGHAHGVAFTLDHSHLMPHAVADHRPPHVKLRLIVRVDNSS